jgi:hypothetical protein
VHGLNLTFLNSALQGKILSEDKCIQYNNRNLQIAEVRERTTKLSFEDNITVFSFTVRNVASNFLLNFPGIPCSRISETAENLPMSGK